MEDSRTLFGSFSPTSYIDVHFSLLKLSTQNFISFHAMILISISETGSATTASRLVWGTFKFFLTLMLYKPKVDVVWTDEHQTPAAEMYSTDNQWYNPALSVLSDSFYRIRLYAYDTFTLCDFFWLRLQFVFACNGQDRSWWCCHSHIVWILPLSPVQPICCNKKNRNRNLK